MNPSGVLQLPLGIGLREGRNFANFEAAGGAEAAAAAAAAVAGTGERVVFLRGGRGCGKTHLLEAACRAASERGARAAYVPLAAVRDGELDVALLGGLEQLELLCLDDVQALAGEPRWEEALFHLYNRAEIRRTVILVAGGTAPAALGLRLPDLVSRLAAAPVFQLRPLDEAGRRRVLRQRARERGFEIPAEVAEFLMRREPRDMHSLMALLERLDRSTLAAQRRVTVPFVKRMLGY